MRIPAEQHRPEAIASLIEQGITDSARLLDCLNFDEAGRQVNNVTLSEVESVVGHGSHTIW
jgi:hypothetical protein